MPSYIETSLVAGEKVAYIGKTSRWAAAGQIFLTCLFFVGGVALIVKSDTRLAGEISLGCTLVLALLAYVKLNTTELAITNKRVIAKFGLISRQTIEISISKVESIQVHQSILGRILNFGSLVIAGAGNPQEPIPTIANPLGFRKALIEVQDLNSGVTPRAD